MSSEPASPGALAARIAALVRDRPLLLALDHDGTLSPIAPRPEDAVLAPDARATLAMLAALDDVDVVVISGRGLSDLDRRVGDLGVALIAEHGLRLRTPDGRIEQFAPGLAPDTLHELRSRLEEVLADVMSDGWIVEDKGVGIAVHHRLVRADRLEPTLSAVRAALDAAADRRADGTASGPAGGRVQAGKAVLELRAIDADKGRALDRIRALRPDALVVMVGDDATDEPALAAAERAGGIGVLVAAAPRTTAASTRLTGPAAVVAFLRALTAELRRREVSPG